MRRRCWPAGVDEVTRRSRGAPTIPCVDDEDGQRDWHAHPGVIWMAGAAAAALVVVLVVAVMRTSDSSNAPGVGSNSPSSSTSASAYPPPSSSTSYLPPSVQTSEDTGAPLVTAGPAPSPDEPSAQEPDHHHEPVRHHDYAKWRRGLTPPSRDICRGAVRRRVATMVDVSPKTTARAGSGCRSGGGAARVDVPHSSTVWIIQ